MRVRRAQIHEHLQEMGLIIPTSLAEIPVVIDIADSIRRGKQELRLAIKPEAEAVGLTLQDLAKQVRQGFYGEEVQRIQRGRDAVWVMLRVRRQTITGRRTILGNRNFKPRFPYHR